MLPMRRVAEILARRRSRSRPSSSWWASPRSTSGWAGTSASSGGSPLTLAFIDIILVLPYAYRAIDSGIRMVDVATLADASSRSLGAGWPRTIFQVIVPNIRGGILSASVLAVALSSSASSRSRSCCRSARSRWSSTCWASAIHTSRSRSRCSALVFAFILLYVITRFAPGAGERAGRGFEEEPAT